MSLFTHPILPDHVAELIDFGGGDPQLGGIRTLQNKGVAALYNILRKGKFAYLADEVGMGKTFQAIGLAAVIRHIKPDARIVFVTPRKILQSQWERDYLTFHERNYRPAGLPGDNRGVSLLLGTPLAPPIHCENLRDFAKALGQPGGHAFFLRHTSFCRPIFFPHPKSPDEIALSWERARQLMVDCGLRRLSAPPARVTAETVNELLNERFAESLNQQLRAWAGDGGIDLLVVDEAQALRHRDNQTNGNFARIFDGVVDRWLFLSATPLHNGQETVRSVVSYADETALADEDMTLERLPIALKRFMVRRPRTYISGTGATLGKDQYRDQRPLPLDGASGVPGLAMALVQKHLAGVLKSQGNRFQVGFLTSFESLLRSTAGQLSPAAEEAEAVPAGASDDYQSRTDPDQRQRAAPQPDAHFIQRLNDKFAGAFSGHSLPHPKLDAVARDLAETAFDRGEKVLVFMRRIAAVKELSERLEQAFHERVEARIRDHWGDAAFDWKTGPSFLKTIAEDAAPEAEDDAADEDGERMDELPPNGGDKPPAGFRQAFQEGQWLHKYRRSFVDSGRNALFFEENWFLLLARLHGKDPAVWVGAVPERLWREAAGGGTNGEPRLSPAQRRIHITHRMLRDHAEALDLPVETARLWAYALEQLYPAVKLPRRPSDAPHPDKSLLHGEGFWEVLRSDAGDWWPDLDAGLARTEPDPLLEAIYRRQLVKNWIGQSIRLSDTLIDLCYIEGTRVGAAESPVGHARQLAHGAVEWLCSDAPGAGVLRRRIADWSRESDLIRQTCFGKARETLAELAAAGSHGELNNQIPVIGIVGGSDVNERAVLQFKTPAYPLVLVCTDVLKEGANLHTFCDRVVHYGIAWTAGDLEQRIGRVDRFRSQIERRLRHAPDDANLPKLDVVYPFVENTLERRQVDGVISMVRNAEAVLNGMSASGDGERWTLSSMPDIGLPSMGAPKTVAGNFDPSWEGVKGRSFMAVTNADLIATRSAFINFANRIGVIAADAGFTLKGDPANFREDFQLSRGPEGTDLECRWAFLPGAGCHALRILEPLSAVPVPSIEVFRNRQDRIFRVHSFVLGEKPSTKDDRKISDWLRCTFQMSTLEVFS